MMVVFDLDDTLFRESDFVASGYAAAKEYAEKHGITFDINDVWPPGIKEAYRNHYPAISLTEDARMSLDYLKAQGVKAGIITDGRVNTQTNKINALGLEDYVEKDNIIISGAIAADKTTPIPFRVMMDRNPSETDFVYIGDNPAKDFRQANLLGWTTVMLLDPEHRNVHPQDLPTDISYHPQITTESLHKYIKQLLNN